MDKQIYNLQNNRGEQKPKKNINFKLMKKNTINSLNEVECFLHSLGTFCKGIKLYNILK